MKWRRKKCIDLTFNSIQDNIPLFNLAWVGYFSRDDDITWWTVIKIGCNKVITVIEENGEEKRGN